MTIQAIETFIEDTIFYVNLGREGDEVMHYLLDLLKSVEVDLSGSSDGGESFMVLGNVDSITLVGLGLMQQEDVDAERQVSKEV